MKRLNFLVLFFLLAILSFGQNLYYGRVTNIRREENGEIKAVEMYSDYQKEFIFNFSKNTYWIDSRDKSADFLKSLKEDDRVYIFYENIVTASLPPQSLAIAVIKNTPQDMMSAQYHLVEDVIVDKDGVKLQVENGSLFIKINSNTVLSPYRTKSIVKIKDIIKGSKIIAWYQPYATVYPGTTYAKYIMLLPEIK